MGMMGGKGGGKNALAAKPNLLSALRIQTSSYGQVIPIIYGQNRIAGRLIWAGDFTAVPHTSTTKVGGKGLGSGGGNAISNTTYYESLITSNPVPKKPEVDAQGYVHAPIGPGIALPAGLDYPDALLPYVDLSA